MPQFLGKEVGPIGYGLMGLTWRPNPQSIEESIKTMKAALNAGDNFWDAGELYGTEEYNSLHLLNKYFTQYPEDADKVILCIKGASPNLRPDPTPQGIRTSIDNCLRILDGKKKLDLFEPARLDRDVPLEDTLNAIDEYVKAGKVGGITLSEVSAATVLKAAEITKIHGVEVEVSLFSLDIFNNGIANACAKHDIPIIAYSPISRGLLSGDLKTPEDLPADDRRRMFPRFQGDNLVKNLELSRKVVEIAEKRGVTPAQLAINWVRHFSKKDGNPEIIPIPGATTISRVVENSKVVELESEDLASIDASLKGFEVAGPRYPAAFQAHVEV